MPKAFQDLLANPQALVASRTQAMLKERFESFGQMGSQLYQQFLDTVKHALTAGVTRLFTIGIIFAGLALLLAFLLKEIPLKKDEFFKEGAAASGNGVPQGATNGDGQAPARAAAEEPASQ
jgi:hypothetical protein